MLSLAEIEEGHHGCLLVLWGISLENLIDEFVVLLGELEGNGRVIFGGVTVLEGGLDQDLLSFRLLKED